LVFSQGGLGVAKVADVKLGWSPSVSLDVVKQVVAFSVNGAPREVELTRDVQELVIEVAASSSVQFTVTTVDSENQAVSSEVYNFVLGDLEPPQPATGLFHEIIAVREV